MMVLLPLVLAAAGGEQMIDRVAAVVNDEPILLSEVRQRAAPELVRLEDPSDPAERERRQRELMRTALQVLIDERLLDEQLKEANIEVGDEQLQAAIDDVKRQNNLQDDKTFAEALSREGLTPEGYRDKLRHDLEKMKLLNLKVHNQAKVSDNDIQEAYQRTYLQPQGEVEVHAHHILIALKRGATPEEEAHARDRAKEISQRAREGEDFAKLAHDLSDGPSAAQGGDLGYFRKGVMVPEFEAVAFNLPVGAVSDPVRTQFGYHIIKVEDRRKAPPPPFEQVKEQLRQKLTHEQMDRLTADYLSGLRKDSSIDIKMDELKPTPLAGHS